MLPLEQFKFRARKRSDTFRRAKLLHHFEFPLYRTHRRARCQLFNPASKMPRSEKVSASIKLYAASRAARIPRLQAHCAIRITLGQDEHHKCELIHVLKRPHVRAFRIATAHEHKL